MAESGPPYFFWIIKGPCLPPPNLALRLLKIDHSHRIEDKNNLLYKPQILGILEFYREKGFKRKTRLGGGGVRPHKRVR